MTEPVPPGPFHFPHSPPPWWPPTEPWPPGGPPARRLWRHRRGRLFARVALLVATLFALLFAGCVLLGWLVVEGARWMPPGRPRPLMLGLLALALGLGGILLIGRALRQIALPFANLMEAAGRVEAGDYTTRLVEHGPREIRALAHAFNAMVARLQHNEAQRRGWLADVIHELRTPLAVIQGNLEGLLDGIYPADATHLTPILEETRVLARLIDDLRTLSLAESGALKLQREPTDLGVLVSEVAASFRAQAAAAGVAVQTEVADEIPLIEVDPTRLREVLTNLITNALRHTPRGGTIVMAGRVTEDKSAVALTVRDNGAGIPAEILPHLFERFYKSPASTGMGLGLAIAHDLVQAHGGTLSAESEPGRGATFRFTLPL